MSQPVIDIRTPAPSWAGANREVLWGWKRDSRQQQRVIIFGCRLGTSPRKSTLIEDWFLFYRNRARSKRMGIQAGHLRHPDVRRVIGEATLGLCHRTGLPLLELSGGPSLAANLGLIHRLLNRRPRKLIPIGYLPSPSSLLLDLATLGPIAAYVGSGLSYEAGLPTLASVHETFGVDHLGDRDFTFGIDDPIPAELSKDLTGTFRRFVAFHLLAADATPSSSHRALADLHQRGVVSTLLTDNIDNLFHKIDTPFIRTRGIGVFNDTHKIVFKKNEKTLLVIGVAADRRGIIRQARAQGLRIVVVNPKLPVSPRSQNLSYMRQRDTWFRMTASEFFRDHVR